MFEARFNTWSRPFKRVGLGSVLLWIVIGMGCPQPPVRGESGLPLAHQNARVRELQEERLKVCQEIVRGMELLARHGVQGVDAIWKAREKLLDAQLDLAETKADRVRVHQEMVQGMESWHKLVQDMVRDGGSSSTDELWVRADLLKAKIALEKEQSMPD